MRSTGRWTTFIRAACGGVLGAVLAAAPATAQTATASLRGHVYGPNGAPVSDASVILADSATGFRRGAMTNGSGFYFIGAVPPGTYIARAQRIGFSPMQRTVRMPVGETVTLDLTMSEAAVTLTAITTVATAAGVDTRSPEVSTNVSTEQIENLPLANRNFLNLATLAPGVQTRGAGVSSNGASTNNTNLFIDGASYKSDILPGGVAGQDPSGARTVRGVGTVLGNPFPQSAVQEFRVITQNYKAEYQKATGAVITAATKSGTNAVHGDAFFYGQHEGLFARSYWDIKDKYPQPNFRRSQFGASVGGPIVRDKTHYFASYEGNIQDLETPITFRPPAGLPTPPANLLSGQGLKPVPLNSHLFFGKIDHLINDRQSLLGSVSVRRDADERFFGNSPEGKETVNNQVTGLLLQHAWSAQPFTNQAQINIQRFQWKAAPENLNSPYLEYQQFGINRGGSRSYQNFIQDRVELRNDLSWLASSHAVKGGATLAFLRYNVDRRLDENPVFRFRPDTANGVFPTIPFEAQFQVGDPNLKTSNQQLGLYLQDDWSASRKLMLNLGLRWDYESDWLNNSFHTPDSVASALRTFASAHPFFNANDYITNGNQRKNFFGAIQPRVGFSYDLSKNNSTVVFGGGGLYFDRVPYSIILNEKAASQRKSYVFRFQDPNTTSGTAWDPAYQSRQGLLDLLASGQAGRPELYAIKNDQKPPRSVQTSLGVRQVWRDYQFSVTGTASYGYNYFKWIFGDRNPQNFDRLASDVEALGYANIILSTDLGKTRYRGLMLSASRPMVGDMRWGGDINYTLAKTEVNHYQDVEDPYALDYIPGNALYGFNWMPGRFDERHRIVSNFIVKLPLGIRASTVTTLGSGVPYTLTTGCQGPWDFPDNDPNAFCNKMGFTKPPSFIPSFLATPPGTTARSARPEGKWFGPFGKWAYRNVDLRLQSDIPFGGQQRASLMFDVYNLFNFVNFNYDNLEYNLRWDTNQGAGPFRERIPFQTFDARRAQLGVRYSF